MKPARSRTVDVYAARCPGYEHAGGVLPQLITRMGGINQFVKPGEELALKVNLLRKADPGDAVTTHPSVVRTVAEIIRDGKAQPVIVDSPGGGYRFNGNTLQAIYRVTGMTSVAVATGAELNYDTNY